MKKLESINCKKFEKLENSKLNDLAAIIGGVIDTLTGRQQEFNYSYDVNGSDDCWTTAASGDTKELKKGSCL